MNENSGIYIGGNAAVHVGAMAAGAQARAHMQQLDPARCDDVQRQVDALLVDLRELLAEHGELQNAAAAAETLRQELDAEEPERGKVMKLLQTLSTAVEKFGALAGAVASIEAGLKALF